MATLEEQKEYIRTNYKKLTGKFMAKMLGIRPEKVYALVKELGLKKQIPPATIKPKADMCKNPTLKVPLGNDEGKVPLRIDCRTIILIPSTANPEECRKSFLRKINSKHSNHILI